MDSSSKKEPDRFEQNWKRVYTSYCSFLAQQLDLCDTDVVLSSGNPPGDLYDKRNRMLNMTFRKIIKNRSLFPNDEAIFKLMYLSLKNISKKWTMPIHNWSAAMNQFAIMFEGRLPMGDFQGNSFTQNF